MRIYRVTALLIACFAILSPGCDDSSTPVVKPTPGVVQIKVYLLLSNDTLHDTVGSPTNQGCRLTKDEIKSYIHALQQNGPKVFGAASSRWSWGEFSGANWDNTNRRIQKAGAFSGYTFESGDKVTISSGTGVTAGDYDITAADANALTVSVDINGSGGDLTDGSVSGVLEIVQVVRTNAIPETRATPERRTDARPAITDVVINQGKYDMLSINIYFGGWMTPVPTSDFHVEGGTVDPRQYTQGKGPVPHIFINDRGWNSGSNKEVILEDHVLEHEVGHYLLRNESNIYYTGLPPGGEHTPEGVPHLMDEESPHALVLPPQDQKPARRRIMEGEYNNTD